MADSIMRTLIAPCFPQLSRWLTLRALAQPLRWMNASLCPVGMCGCRLECPHMDAGSVRGVERRPGRRAQSTMEDTASTSASSEDRAEPRVSLWN